ncbi:N-acetylglucosamine-1-phosphate uridyltransferase [Desulfocucumis palustris]|uniref:Bifunctional protein GlmU n=1 Tax=Desulfocucumis palustris TaxID=1898651 RepID=A0A2L2X9N1_9FIRM|nr:bifunctional UDP-N-acetylglucosamine diphosphorylase/glucosamine-1-phosphate N-acetyltransferase GlmU [Desulfocucumis palustris]GBF32848.1 N-acetylglucosamine-1-phosphate uridyltransferase [Desulfocucumis palustris]
MGLAAVVLAAGKGTRMKSDLPKVLHKVCGTPIVNHVLSAVEESGAGKIVVVAGYGGEQVVKQIEGRAQVVYQLQQLGTAHALLQAGDLFKDFEGHILVICGDTPLITAKTLREMVIGHINSGAAATVLTAVPANPGSYGRIIRDHGGGLIKIVEQKDATPEQLAVREINTGMYCFKSEGLFEALSRLTPDNAQGEYYLTDIIEAYVSSGRKVEALACAGEEEILGINDRCQLAEAERIFRRRILEQLMLSGVTIVDPASTYVDSGVEIGLDTIIYPNTILESGCHVGERCILGPGAHLTGARLGNDVTVRYSVLERSEVSDGCSIGPFSYIRPDCRLGKNVKVGDFVELKKTTIDEGSKVPHLSYVGDAALGKKVNIGAGTITCNYDGVSKWPTVIGDNAFIGSNTNLVAPVNVGDGAVTGAGSTITKDVPPGALGVARGRQQNIANWKKRKKAAAGPGEVK